MATNLMYFISIKNFEISIKIFKIFFKPFFVQFSSRHLYLFSLSHLQEQKKIINEYSNSLISATKNLCVYIFLNT